MNRLKILFGMALLLSSMSCRKNSSTEVDIQETAQQLGDTMASIDEAGGSSGVLSLRESSRKTFARFAPDEIQRNSLFDLAIPEAEATTCSVASTFGTCSSGTVVRNFGGCTVGSAVFNGTVTFTRSSGSCSALSNGQSISRVPNFTITGRRGSTLTVVKTGTHGQVLTRGATANDWTFSNDGIRRYFSTSAGVTFLDFTTETTSAMTITGANRSGRVLNGGQLRVTHNITGVTCDYTPSAVTWGASCNCATSGTWSATCSDGRTSVLTLTGCGTGSFSMGDQSENVTMDRCY